MSEPVSDEYLEVLTKAFQDSIEGVIVIGSSVVEVEVDGETKYKVVFELEATEETVEAAQQEEEEVTRINNSLVLPVSSTQTTTTRIESSVFIPVSSTGSADGVVQALVEAIKDQGIEVESFTFDPETGELSYVVKIVNYAGSGSLCACPLRGPARLPRRSDRSLGYDRGRRDEAAEDLRRFPPVYAEYPGTSRGSANETRGRRRGLSIDGV